MQVCIKISNIVETAHSVDCFDFNLDKDNIILLLDFWE